MSMQAFFDMGGYGFYVWSCYGIAACVFIALYIAVKTQHKNLVEQLRRQARLKQKQST